jgi:hypothetical protein
MMFVGYFDLGDVSTMSAITTPGFRYSLIGSLNNATKVQ